MRTPRYFDNGRYRELNDNVITSNESVKLNVPNTHTPTNGYGADDAFENVIPLIFKTTAGAGAFSFYLQFPVYGVSKKPSKNGGSDATTWYVRTGFGSELYSMDDGTGSGGCITMSIGRTSYDWIDIFWKIVN